MPAMLMTRGEVREVFGLGWRKLAGLVQAGKVRPRHFLFDGRGRPKDRARYVRGELERMIGGIGK